MHANINFCIWAPHPEAISYTHYRSNDHDDTNGDFWYFYIGREITFGLGKYPENEKNEIEFLRKLASDALKIADKMEKRLADRGMTPIITEGLDQ